MPADDPILTTRNKLRAKGIYLADNRILERVAWFKTRSFHRVCRTTDIERYEHQLRKHLDDPDNFERPPAPAPVKLSVIVRVSDRDYFLLACGGWAPWTGGKLETVRASAYAEDPMLPAISGDHDNAMKNLHVLLERMLPDKTDRQRASGLINWRQPNRFKFGHRAFERRSADEPLAPPDEDTVEDDPEFQIGNLPLKYEEARPALSNLVNTHVAIPLPAFSFGAKPQIIRPSRYEQHLRGAVICLQFALDYWLIEGTQHVFTADVLNILVLEPPPPADKPTPRRKRVRRFYNSDEEEDEMDAMPATPTKKKRGVGA